MAIGRFIPACAGNSTSWLMPLPTGSVHPRLRGELQGRARLEEVKNGSSPLARGTPPVLAELHVCSRFIPACAGNSSMTEALDIKKYGSSPLARGTPNVKELPRTECRFIPACAGNSYCSHLCSPDDSVHPRLRGELIAFRRINRI